MHKIVILLYLIFGQTLGLYAQETRLEAQLHAPVHWAKTARSTLALIPKRNMQQVDGGWQLSGRKMSELGYCDDAEFSDQRLIANCSGSLIAENKVLTAAHCLTGHNSQCEDYAFVFDYALKKGPNKDYFVRDDQVYFCDEVVHFEFNPRNMSVDLAIVKLQKAVTDRRPVDLNRQVPEIGEPLTMIGHPMGIFQKFVDQSEVLKIDMEKLSFRHRLQTYSVNSGGPIFNANQEQIGVLVRSTKPNMQRREGESCYDWGVYNEQMYSEANLLINLPL